MSHAPARTRRTLAAAAASVTVLGLLAGCGSDSADAGEGGKPVLRVGVQKDGIRSVLTEAGLLEDLPYEIEWSEFTAGPPIIEAAAADQIDVAWVGSAPPIFGAAADAAFKVVATVEERDQKQDSILVPEGSDVTSVADLKGKTIAVAKGTSGHGHLLLALEDAGMTLDDVEPQYLAPADGLAAFQSGEVDAWAIWEPFVTQAVQEDGAVNITADQGAATDPYLQFEIASSASLEEEDTRESIQHFVGLLEEGFAWAVDNPEKWGEGWAEESGLPSSTTIAVATSKAADVVPVSEEHIASEQQLADAFFEAGEIPVEIDFADLVEPGLID
ncbi:ABC transporter substrate-binding protein [Nocardioides dongkuii]|uniref:ABC transporter substrate-binding protein n=1 Tax=Nocardioides dongkuii TaxID=2760089 RepID=UPI001878E98E|nr:ABC transporter substrate-binding protein [Nocardioides dongkuii]